MPGSHLTRRRSPLATALLVVVVLAGLLPVPAAIAVESPIVRPPVAQADATPPEQQPSEIQLTISGESGAPPRFAVPDFIALSSDAETREAASARSRGSRAAGRERAAC